MAKKRHGKKQAERRRQREKQADRRRAGTDPYRRIGARGDLVSCHVNRRWGEQGMATVFVVRRVPGGAQAMATFLIDLWCMGLKDAWGRLDMTMEELNDIFDEWPTLEFEEVDFDIARRLIRGSIRFARKNGFRLPRRYERWVEVAGIRDGADDADDADMVDFGRDGRLVYMGSLEDLGSRLIGQPLEAFLERDDVQFAVVDDEDRISGNSDLLIEEFLERIRLADAIAGLDPELLEENELAEEEVEQALEQTRHRMMDAIRRWCFAQGIEPHPRLEDAWQLNEIVLLNAPCEPEESEESEESGIPSAPEIETMRSSLDAFLEMGAPQDREELSGAFEQLSRFMNQFESEEEMLAAIGDLAETHSGGRGHDRRDRSEDVR